MQEQIKDIILIKPWLREAMELKWQPLG